MTVEKWLKQLGKRLDITDISTYSDEFLLKACASRQEKLPFCHENSAPPNAYIRDLRRIALRRQKQVARPTDLDALAEVNSLARRHSFARDEITDRTARR